ncbi:MAG: TPM domain-containing protein [Bacteroidetes bacterium]|nr:TPM domain-containing protein [Bacteroidota bacterium]MCL6098245.1 TPM domain-containing protein [Bacteroidota bacterium]
MDGLIYNYFSDDEFLRVSNKIKDAEKTTSGEIRVAIKEHRHFFDRKKNLRQLAEKEFHKLNMHNTRDKTGILLFMLLSDRQFYILADQGIHEKVGNETWDKLRDEIQNKFQSGNFCDGILWGVDRVGKILTKHFPIKTDDTNELSNEIVIT